MGACSSHLTLSRKKGDCSTDNEGSKKSKEKTQKGKDKLHDGSADKNLTRHSNGTSCNGSNNELSSSDEKTYSLHSFASTMFDADNLLSIYDLYNILNDGANRPFIQDPSNFLVIDSRELHCFTESRVITAKQHAHFMSNTESTSSLTKYVMVIIYGNELKNDKYSQQLLDLMHRIEEYIASDILVLRDGFDLFKENFPYLCTDRDIDSVADRKLLLCYPSVICDDMLYQGRGDQATNEKIVDTLGITHILNISEHRNAFPLIIKYLKIPLDDLATTDLSQHFHKTSMFIKDALSNGGRVLVHCNLGVSRSSTITLAYLMKCKQWKLGFAYSFLKAKRMCICPNSGFLRQLSEWELQLFGEKHTNIDD